jgi:hypothetical protein
MTRWLIAATLLIGCGAEPAEVADARRTPDAGGLDGGGAATGTGGTGGWLDGDTSKVERCDGLDNDGDGRVDDGCSCIMGETQECYPSPTAPAEGCARGQQSCASGDWGQADCIGASFPADGEAACCTVLGTTPEHTLHDAFVAAYPASAMPKTHDGVNAFEPEVDGYTMAYSSPNAGNEICDENAGGVSVACVEKGRAVSRQKAEGTLAPTTTIVSVREDPVVLEGSGCNGIGWAWGSLLVQADDLAVSEVVYLYIGFCVGGKDTEHFYYSEQPVEVCRPPVVPR